MGRFVLQESGTPKRLAPTHARLLIGLSIFILVIAAFGLFLYDGWQRVAYVTAFLSIGFGNLVWGVGSLLPEEEGAKAWRNASFPFFVVMLLSLPVALAFELLG